MLELFRNQSRSLVIYILLGIVILAFILTFNTQGPINAGPNAQGVEVLVDVDGVGIDSRELALGNLFSPMPPQPSMNAFEKLQAKQRYEGTRLIWSGVSQELASLTPFDGPVPPVKDEKLMVELIESVLVSKAAEAAGMDVSDEELSARVARLELVFGTSFRDEQGRFDARKYDIFVRFQLGTSKAALESFLRREILRDKYVTVATAGLEVSDAELDAVDAAESKRPKLEVVTVDARAARSAVVVSDEDATAFADSHQDEIKAAYDAAGETYVRPAKWKVRGILVKATQKAGVETEKLGEIEGEWAAKRKDADAIYADLDKAWKGETAIDVASGDGASTSKKATELDAAARKAALLGHFSRIAGEKTEHDLSKDVGGRFIDAKSAAGLGLSPFGPAVATAVAAAQDGGLVGPVEGSHGWWILVVESAEAASTTPLETAKVELAKSLLAEQKAAEQLDTIAKGVLDAVQAAKDKPLSEAVQAWNKAHGGKTDGPLVATTSGMIGRAPTSALSRGFEAALGLPARDQSDDDVPGIGKVKGMTAAARKLSAEAPIAGEVFASEDGKSRYVVRLAAEVTTVTDAEGETKRRDDLRRLLLSQKRAEVWRGVVKTMLQKAEADKAIDRSDAWTALVDQQRKRLIEAEKRAAAQAPALGMPSGGQPIQLNLGGDQNMPTDGNFAVPTAPVVPEAPAAPVAPEAPAAPAAPAEPAAQ